MQLEGEIEVRIGKKLSPANDCAAHTLQLTPPDLAILHIYEDKQRRNYAEVLQWGRQCIQNSQNRPTSRIEARAKPLPSSKIDRMNLPIGMNPGKFALQTFGNNAITQIRAVFHIE